MPITHARRPPPGSPLSAHFNIEMVLEGRGEGGRPGREARVEGDGSNGGATNDGVFLCHNQNGTPADAYNACKTYKSSRDRSKCQKLGEDGESITRVRASHRHCSVIRYWSIPQNADSRYIGTSGLLQEARSRPKHADAASTCKPFRLTSRKHQDTGRETRAPLSHTTLVCRELCVTLGGAQLDIARACTGAARAGPASAGGPSHAVP